MWQMVHHVYRQYEGLLSARVHMTHEAVNNKHRHVDDAIMCGWQPTPGIVSVWANRAGHAVIWQRVGDELRCWRDQFRPWIVATTLADVQHLDPIRVTAATATALPLSYRVLDGPDEAYRYLLSAPPGYHLERALLAGAAHRMRQPITRLSDLDRSYYRVGPVEQYLMATGQVYFRGLRYEDLHRLQFDLETTALDAAQGRIFLVAVRDSYGFSATLEASSPAHEPQLIADLCALVCARDPDIIENHNVFGFDLPFLEQRAAILGVPLYLGRAGPPGIRLPHVEHYTDPGGYGPLARRRQRVSVPGREIIDTLDAVRRYDFAARDLSSYRLKDVARHFGVASAERTYLHGAMIADTYRRDPDTVRRYALDDVAEVDALSQRLLGAPFALAGMAPRRYERVASAGPAMGILEPLLVRAYLRAGAALPHSPAPRDGAPHAGGAVQLYAAGVAEHVVKADVASLYPSIMRTYRIGPACDPLGALLHLLDRLTELRLHHKAAMRSAPPGSLARGQHAGSQAAMKTLINAAYGYLGAGQMALFADWQAANEVTRRGRQILQQVVQALQGHGMALIEADTDGVYFAVPPHWEQAEEQALVAEVAATLPEGIRLEYDGRYRAMLSHEIKNYAILTYTGELILRGVALRSSRAEPYGERFVRQAVQCVLLGDVLGVWSAFLAMVTALRDRALPAADVAARLRLAKTPAQYQASRQRLREPQYEALLAAGRTVWGVGERVRVYRAQHGTMVWLPDDHQLDSTGENVASRRMHSDEQRDYDVEHYIRVLQTSYARRLQKAFTSDAFAQVFRVDGQAGLWDLPLDQIEPIKIRCIEPPVPNGGIE
jgi:DNA polymerase elongation subunit (family B)